MKHKSDSSRLACEGKDARKWNVGFRHNSGLGPTFNPPRPFSPSLSGSLEVWSTFYSQKESSPNCLKINVTLLQRRKKKKKRRAPWLPRASHF